MAPKLGLVLVALSVCLLKQTKTLEQLGTASPDSAQTRLEERTSCRDITCTRNSTQRTNKTNIPGRNLTILWMEHVTTPSLNVADVSATIDHGNGNDTLATTSADIPEVTPPVTATPENDKTEGTGNGAGPIVKSVEVGLSLFGFIFNGVTVVILARHGRGFGCFTLLLLRHQSVVDGYLCIAATVLFLQPAMWSTGVPWLDWFVCHFWHTQFFYWTYSLVSAWNIVFMAVDRSVAVCFPMRHKRVSSCHVIGTFVAMHVASFAMCIPPLFMVRISRDDGTCERESALPPEVTEKLNYGFAIFYLLVAYLLPVAAFTALYSHVLVTIRRRLRPVSLGAANCLSIMTLRVTKCAVAVTVIFVLTVGYDVIYFFVSSMGVTEYEFDSPQQLAGIFLNLCNSVSNPIVYVILLPTFRSSMRRTFLCSSTTRESTDDSTYVSSPSPPSTKRITEDRI